MGRKALLCRYIGQNVFDDWIISFLKNVTPGFVATAMSKITRTSFTSPSAESYAKSAVATIGIQNNTCGCFPHALQVRGGKRGEGKILIACLFVDVFHVQVDVGCLYCPSDKATREEKLVN